MTETDWTILSLRVVRVILEVAGYAIVGQGIMWVLARAMGQDPANNFFYKVLSIVPLPFNKLARLITPRFIPDVRMPLVALCLIVVAYFGVTVSIANACVARGLPVAQCFHRG